MGYFGFIYVAYFERAPKGGGEFLVVASEALCWPGTARESRIHVYCRAVCCDCVFALCLLCVCVLVVHASVSGFVSRSCASALQASLDRLQRASAWELQGIGWEMDWGRIETKDSSFMFTLWARKSCVEMFGGSVVPVCGFRSQLVSKLI